MCLASTPKIGNDGLLYGEFHILDLPNGRILKTLCDYGTTIGVSSRGNGDLVEDMNGDSSVDPDSFDLTCWDAVLLPSVKEARMNFITESLGKKSLKESLDTLIKNSDDADKKIMEATIKNVEQKLNEGITTQKSENINNVAKDNGTNEIIKSLTEALKAKTLLENQVKELQEALAVRDSKVNELSNKLDTYKETTIRLTNIAGKGKDLSKENSQLKESLEQANKQIEELNSKNSQLIEQKRQNISSRKSLNESILKEQLEKKKLIEQLNSKDKQLEAQKKMYQDKLNKLQESFIKDTKKLNETINSLNSQIDKKSNLVEQYKKIANNTVNKYIDSKAVMLGVSSNEIKNRLPESYTLSDVDRICENLQSYSLNIGKLPFNLRENGIKVQINSPKEESILPKIKIFDPDEVDETLIDLAKSRLDK